MEPSKRDSLVSETAADVATSNENLRSDAEQSTTAAEGEPDAKSLKEVINHEDPQMPTAENLATNIVTLASTAVDKLKGVGSMAAESAVNVGRKIEEGDLGPYDSPASCAPSDMDPIAMAVHSGLDMKKDVAEEKEDESDR